MILNGHHKGRAWLVEEKIPQQDESYGPSTKRQHQVDPSDDFKIHCASFVLDKIFNVQILCYNKVLSERLLA